LRLAKAGMKVAVVARSLNEVDAVAERIHAGGGIAASAVCDVAKEPSVSDAIGLCIQRLGPIDVLVNNAGRAKSRAFAKLTLEEWQGTLDVNLTGAFLVTREVLPGMVARRWGRVVNIASTAGLRGCRYTAHYCASKHGLVGLTRALAVEFADRGITTNAVCPGWVQTEMLEAAVVNIAEKTGRGVQEAKDLLRKDMPTGRFVTPESVAELVAFLVSEHASEVNGATLTMDGGQLA
jgi:NAD(P)-dependent dehydrogenase (short-subunit alcohol dehydrogenase family)